MNTEYCVCVRARANRERGGGGMCLFVHEILCHKTTDTVTLWAHTNICTLLELGVNV